MRVIFCDTETTGLDPERHELWEVGFIVYDTDLMENPEDGLSFNFLVEPVFLEDAEPGALRTNHFYQRTYGLTYSETPDHMDAKGESWSDPFSLARYLALAFEDALVIGNNPAFDETFLGKFLRQHSQQLANFHRKINVVDMGLGWLQAQAAMGQANEEMLEALKLPHSSKKVLDACGCPKNKAEHTALGDAEHVRDAYFYLARER
jgi:DNA polymerase III epsilon subunit-like protein